jgi:cytochrome P450
MQCYTTHRDPVVFPDPESFSPDRWIKSNGGTSEMKEAFMPFTKGTRVCLGKNLAMMELKVITTIILRRFHVSIAAEMTMEDMAMKDHFLLFPQGKKCKLVFTPRN